SPTTPSSGARRITTGASCPSASARPSATAPAAAEADSPRPVGRQQRQRSTDPAGRQPVRGFRSPSPPAPMSEVSRILSAAGQGNPAAAAELLPLVYGELRRLAAQKLLREKPGQTLDATALVHESYLRLVGDQQFDGRGHFFAAAAEAMRRILVEAARRK